jgi:hypothetical protein
MRSADIVMLMYVMPSGTPRVEQRLNSVRAFV